MVLVRSPEVRRTQAPSARSRHLRSKYTVFFQRDMIGTSLGVMFKPILFCIAVECLIFARTLLREIREAPSIRQI